MLEGNNVSPQYILCIGSNNVETDHFATDMANLYNTINRGLLLSQTDIEIPGVYHTSVVDISPGEIILKSDKFDLVVMLDQPRSSWSHWKIFQTTYKVMVELEQAGKNVIFRNNKNIKSLEKIEKLVTTNKSWCVYPWINLVSRDDGIKLCARSPTMLTDKFSIDEWKNSKTRKDIQQKMLSDQKIPESCSICYQYENLGIESYRQFESREWLNYLNIDSVEELAKIESPKYYEIHWSNRCNLKCRGCDPTRSSAIEQEFKKYKIIVPLSNLVPTKYPGIDIVDIPTLEKNSRVYVTGGEPLIMPETLEFMNECIKQNRTDFEFTMSTNGVKIPKKFRELSQHFSNLNFSFSIDGFEKINDYWRSGSKWNSIVDNMHDMQSLGHSITINTVPGIYNVTNLHLLFEWLDQEFPLTSIYLQINHNSFQSAYNFPDAKLVIDSMERCRKTKVYWSDGKSCRSGIDSIYDHYNQNPTFDAELLEEFFKFNDQLDLIRGVSLRDYIPELDACRRYLKK